MMYDQITIDGLVSAFAEGNRKNQERIALLEAELRRIKLTKPATLPSGRKDYIIREDEHWITGVTEYAGGVWSSVWMKNKNNPLEQKTFEGI